MISEDTMATFRSKEDSVKDQVPLHRFQERIGAFHAMIQMISNRMDSELWTLGELQDSLCKLVSLFSLCSEESRINFWGQSGGGHRPNDIRCKYLRAKSRDERNSH